MAAASSRDGRGSAVATAATWPGIASGDASSTAIFSGAGLSHAAPAGLPLGEPFHRRLRALAWERAGPLVGDLLDPQDLERLTGSQGNFLARIENTAPGLGAAALACMGVVVPNEGHLLAALHLAHGGLHITVNFDDGIERAYALLAGETGLPAEASPGQRAALAGWRACMPDPPPVMVVRWRPEAIAASPCVRPLLVKLHGSMGLRPDGVTLPLAPLSDDVDAGDLGGARHAALAHLGAAPSILVTGFSARDLASRVAVMAQLSRGRFAWVAPAVDEDVRAEIATIDPSQPVTGLAAEAIRALLPCSPPAWPGGATPTFDARLDRWAAGLPEPVAAEAVGWALCDAGLSGPGLAILRRVVRHGGAAGSRMRLGDATARGATPRTLAAARRTLLRVATSRDVRGLRAHAVARWAETRPLPARARTVPEVGRFLGDAALVYGATMRVRQPPARVRAATVVLGRLLRLVERTLVDRPPSPLEARALRGAARAGAWLADRELRASSAAPSGRRRAMLERQRIELEVLAALLAGRAPGEDRRAALDRLMAVFRHVADPEGVAATAGTMGLAALAMGDGAACEAAIDRASGILASADGVVALTAAVRARSTGTAQAGLKPDRTASGARPGVP